VDPVQGGTANNYVYVLDPVGEFDLTGNMSQYQFDQANAQVSYKLAKATCGGWQAILCMLPGGEGLKGSNIAVKVGESAMNSKHLGVASKLLGNPSLKTAQGLRAVRPGLLNNPLKNVRIGWSVHNARPVLRAVIGKGKQAAKHLNILYGRFR
jgi:hypothetical protein